MQDGPPAVAAPGRAHEQGAFVGPEQTGHEGMAIVGLEGFPESGAQNVTSPGGGGFTIPAATIVNGSVNNTYNLSMTGFPRLAGDRGLAMGDNAIKLKSGTWLMLAYGFAWPSGGCVVAGPAATACKYTLYTMVGKNSSSIGEQREAIPLEWEYRSQIADPKKIGAEGPCEPQFTELRDGRILLLMRYLLGQSKLDGGTMDVSSFVQTSDAETAAEAMARRSSWSARARIDSSLSSLQRSISADAESAAVSNAASSAA